MQKRVSAGCVAVTAATLAMTLACGCGAIMRSAREGIVYQTVHVADADGNPIRDASVWADGYLSGKTDVDGLIKHELDAPDKGDIMELKVQAPGYQTYEAELKAIIDPGFLAGDIIVGIGLGGLPLIATIGVDAVTNHWLAFQRFVEVVMTKGSDVAGSDSTVKTKGKKTSRKVRVKRGGTGTPSSSN